MQTDRKNAVSTVPTALQGILVAAEIEFAESGFDGAGMKAIAQRADVSQSLLHYHFGNKENLYAEVIRHRSQQINEGRRSQLAVVDPLAEGAASRILDALFRPTLGPEGGGKAYARIFAGLMVGRARDQQLVHECYDPTAKLFIDALVGTGMSQGHAGMVYQFALGVLASVISRDGRMERLMGLGGPCDTDALIAAMVRFVEGGAAAVGDP